MFNIIHKFIPLTYLLGVYLTYYINTTIPDLFQTNSMPENVKKLVQQYSIASIMFGRTNLRSTIDEYPTTLEPFIENFKFSGRDQQGMLIYNKQSFDA